MRRSAALFLSAALMIGSPAAARGDGRLLDTVRQGNRAAVRELLQRRVDVDATGPDGSTALVLAADRSDLATAELLIHAKANVNVANEYGATALYAACAGGNLALITLLLESKADPNASLLSVFPKSNG